MTLMTKFVVSERVRITALLSSLSGKTGVVKSILSQSAGSTKYLVKMDDSGDELTFAEWELGRYREDKPTQSRFVSRRG